VNVVSLLGRIDNEPELSGLPGRDVCELWLIVNGPRDKRPLHVKVVAFRKLAEHCAEQFNRSNRVAVTGALRSEEWPNHNGRGRQFVHSIVAREVHLASAAEE
jgi:single-stranded DNA-binding protein